VIRIYRRHVKSCPHTSERERRCKCPIHCEGQLGDERIKPHSLKLTSWEAAAKKIQGWQAAGTTKAIPRIKLAEAIAGYKADCEARKLSPATQHKISVLLKALQSYADLHGLGLLAAVGVPELRRFRETWTSWGALTQTKNIERLRAFYRFCVQSKWLTESAAQFLKPPRASSTKVSVFTDKELSKIHTTIKSPIMRAFILVLQHTGLRISDAVQLRKQDIASGKLRIITKKNKSVVWLPLSPSVLAALDAIKTTEFYFWTGESKLSTAIGSRRRGVAKLFHRAGVKGSPHTFRHTLATNLLANGTSPAIVAKILGNSERVVSKFYDHWIPARQIQLESELQKTWNDPKLVRVK
jgi:integrase